MTRLALWTIAATLLVSAPAAAQVTLRHKLPENSSYGTNVYVKTQQVMSIVGMNQESSSEQNMVIRTTLGKRAADGTLRAESQVEQVQTRIKAPGIGEINFDSVNPEKATESPLTPLLKASAKGSWTTVYNKDGVVTAVEGRDKALESLEPNVRDAVKGQYDPEYLKESANKALGRLPGNPVKVGDSWEQTETLRVDAAQSLTFKKKYTYRGTVAKDGRTLDQIDVKSSSIQLDINPVGPLPLKLAKSDLKIVDSKGAILFDRELGRIVSDSQKNQIKGSLTLSIAGQELPAELDLTLETNTSERP